MELLKVVTNVSKERLISVIINHNKNTDKIKEVVKKTLNDLKSTEKGINCELILKLLIKYYICKIPTDRTSDVVATDKKPFSPVNLIQNAAKDIREARKELIKSAQGDLENNDYLIQQKQKELDNLNTKLTITENSLDTKKTAKKEKEKEIVGYKDELEKSKFFKYEVAGCKFKLNEANEIIKKAKKEISQKNNEFPFKLLRTEYNTFQATLNNKIAELTSDITNIKEQLRNLRNKPKNFFRKILSFNQVDLDNVSDEEIRLVETKNNKENDQIIITGLLDRLNQLGEKRFDKLDEINEKLTNLKEEEEIETFKLNQEKQSIILSIKKLLLYTKKEYYRDIINNQRIHDFIYKPNIDFSSEEDKNNLERYKNTLEDVLNVKYKPTQDKINEVDKILAENEKSIKELESNLKQKITCNEELTKLEENQPSAIENISKQIETAKNHLNNLSIEQEELQQEISDIKENITKKEKEIANIEKEQEKLKNIIANENILTTLEEETLPKILKQYSVPQTPNEIQEFNNDEPLTVKHKSSGKTTIHTEDKFGWVMFN